MLPINLIFKNAAFVAKEFNHRKEYIMVMIEKGLTEKQPISSRSGRVESEISVAQPENKIVKQAAPRSSINMSDWDDVKRVANDGERDRYYVPPHLVPDGFSVEWKRIEILGKPDKANVVKLEASGWRPAPSEAFREILPSGYSQPFVEDGEGMGLYIRPMRMTDEANAEQKSVADQKVRDYENATMNRITGHRDVPNKVHAFSRTYEKSNIPVPD